MTNEDGITSPQPEEQKAELRYRCMQSNATGWSVPLYIPVRILLSENSWLQMFPALKILTKIKNILFSNIYMPLQKRSGWNSFPGCQGLQGRNFGEATEAIASMPLVFALIPFEMSP